MLFFYAYSCFEQEELLRVILYNISHIRCNYTLIQTGKAFLNLMPQPYSPAAFWFIPQHPNQMLFGWYKTRCVPRQHFVPPAQPWACRPQEQVRTKLKLDFPNCASCGCQVCIADRSALQSSCCRAAPPAGARTATEKPGFIERKAYRREDPQPLECKKFMSDCIKNWGRGASCR